MAYGIKKISPLDLKPSTAIGVALPFSAQNVFSSVYSTKDQIKYNLINFLLSDPRERPFNPTFGAGLRAQLFEQITQDTIIDLKSSVKSQIENYFPQIEVKTFDIVADPDNHALDISFTYFLVRSKENDSVSITIQNV